MSFKDDIERAVCAFCETVTGQPFGTFLPANRNGYTAEAFGTVLLIGDVGSMESTHVPDGSGGASLRISGHKRFTLSVQFYGVDAGEWAEDVQDYWATLHSAAETLRGLGYHPSGASGITDISTPGATNMEPRRALTLTGYHRRTKSDTPVGTVDEVTITATLGGQTVTGVVDLTGA